MDLPRADVLRIGVDDEGESIKYKVLAVFGKSENLDGNLPEYAQLVWNDPTSESTDSEVLRLEDAPPYKIGMFEIENLSSDAAVPYVVRGAVERNAFSSDQGSIPDDCYEIFTLKEGRIDKFALASCNGIEEVHDEQATFLWKKLAERDLPAPEVVNGDDSAQEGRPELLIMAGDQVYADSVRTAWKKNLVESSGELVSAYRRRYVSVWGDPDVQDVLARVPSLMIWDDHDIYNGYGSHDRDHVERKSREALFSAAKTAFDEFQVRANPQALGTPQQEAKAYSFCIGDTAFVVTDGRTNRDYKNGVVLGGDQEDAIIEEVEHLVESDDPLKHLFVVVGIPFYHVGRKSIEHVARMLNLRDKVKSLGLLSDLRDGWTSKNNKEAFADFIGRLSTATTDGSASETHVNILSGDIHVGTMATLDIAETDQKIAQITSSSIGYPPPSGLMTAAMDGFDVFRDSLVEDHEAPEAYPEDTINVEGEFQSFDGDMGAILNHRNYALVDCDTAEHGHSHKDCSLKVRYRWEGNLGVDSGPNDFRTTEVRIDMDESVWEAWFG